MTAISEFTKVRLKSGVVATVLEVLGNGEAFLVEVETEVDDWDTLTVARGEIVAVLNEVLVAMEG